jgi:hypothetical protein
VPEGDAALKKLYEGYRRIGLDVVAISDDHRR